MWLPMLVTVTLTSICRTSESRSGWGETWRSRISPRNLRSLYFGSTSDEENGWNMRPMRPRFCNVVVVIGVGVGTGVTPMGDVVVGDEPVSDVLERSGVVSGAEGSGVVSWADSPTAVARSIEKIMARRIIDGLNTKR